MHSLKLCRADVFPFLFKIRVVFNLRIIHLYFLKAKFHDFHLTGMGNKHSIYASVCWPGCMFQLIYFPPAIFGGALVERYGCRCGGIVSALCQFLGIGLGSLAPNIYVLYPTIGFLNGE